VRMRRPPAAKSAARKGRAQPVLPLESAAGEEDPGASLDDPEMQQAMRAESRTAGDANARKNYGDAGSSDESPRGTSSTRKPG
jgi:hypothetical protein